MDTEVSISFREMLGRIECWIVEKIPHSHQKNQALAKLDELRRFLLEDVIPKEKKTK